MKECVDCQVHISKYNPHIRCFIHTTINAQLETYVERREKSHVGVERWSGSKTNKTALRERYCRKFVGSGVLPWEVSFTELELIDGSLLLELIEALTQVNFLNRFVRTGEAMDGLISNYSREEAELIDSFLPETNFLTRWSWTQKEGSYQRFRDPIDEAKHLREAMCSQ